MSREIKTSPKGVRYFEVPAEVIGTAKFVVACKELPSGVFANVCGPEDPLPQEYYDGLHDLIFELKDGEYKLKDRNRDPLQARFA